MTPLLIITACIGYFFGRFTYKFKFTIDKASNWHLVFYSVSFGVFFLLSSYIANLMVCKLLLCYSVNTLNYQIGLVLCSAVIAIISSLLINRKYNKVKSYELSIDNDLDQMLFDVTKNKGKEFKQSESIKKNMPLPMQFTLSNRKAYVGIVVDGAEAKKDFSYIAIIPIYSGYRESEELTLRLTIEYQKHQQGIDWKLLTVLIPRKEIIICNIFNEDIYRTERRLHKEKMEKLERNGNPL